MSNIFAQATRAKLRFTTPSGNISVEDLWDLDLDKGRVNLDDIARGLFRQLKHSDDVSFVNPGKKSDAKVQLAFDVVKYIIDVRLAEVAAAAEARANKEKKQKLMALVAAQEDAALAAMPVEELRRMIAAL